MLKLESEETLIQSEHGVEIIGEEEKDEDLRTKFYKVNDPDIFFKNLNEKE